METQVKHCLNADSSSMKSRMLKGKYQGTTVISEREQRMKESKEKFNRRRKNESEGDCSYLHVTNASLRSGDPKDSYPTGTVLQYRCIRGYEPIPGKTLSLTCLANSKWSVENPRFCQGKFDLICTCFFLKKSRLHVLMLVLIFLLGKRCPAINLENGRIVKSNDLRLGDEITLGCNEGFVFLFRYRMIGENTLRCLLIGNSVNWNRDLPLCQRIPCFPPPKIANGRHSGTPDDEYNYGSSVTYTCNPYYSLIGSPTITCLVAADGINGEWRPAAPECKVVVCMKPNIRNGRITTVFKPAYTYGNRVMFVCNRGYTLVGNDSSTCGADNAWHPPVPTCVKGTTTTVATIRPDGSTKKTTSSTRCILAFLIVLSLIAVFWKYRSSMKTGEPEAPSSPAEFDKSVSKSGLEPKGSQLNKVSSGSPFCAAAMAPLTCNFGGPSLSPPPLLLLLLLLSLSRVRGEAGCESDCGTACVHIQYNSRVKFVCDPAHTLVGSSSSKCGADNAWQPPAPEFVKGKYLTTLKWVTWEEAQGINSVNKCQSYCVAESFFICSLFCQLPHQLSPSPFPETYLQPEAPTSPAEFNEAELEPKGSQLYLKWVLVAQVLLLINARSVNGKTTAIPDLIRDEYTDLGCITETCLDELSEHAARSVALLFSFRGSCGGTFSFSDSGRVSLSCDGAPSRLPWRGAVSVGAAVAAAADVFLAVQSSSFRTSSEFLFPIDCTHPRVASATLRSGDPKDSYPAGTVLRYRCIPGYEPIPGETLSLTCLDTSKWSVENPRFCQGKFHLIRRRCTAVTIENGRIVIPSPMQIGDEITLGCNEGYRLIGEKTLRCVLVGDKAEWHTDPPICRQIRCYPPDNIEFGSHSGQPHEEFHYGSTVTYTCNEGFSLIGSPNSTCSPSSTSTAGVWLPRPPKCKVVRCREPEIENGRVTTPTQDIYTYGDRASFECNPGYVMVGRSTCTCGPNHGWIPRFPKCVWDGSIATTAGEGGGGDGAADGGGDVADAGGEDVVDPGQGGDPQTTLPPDEIGTVEKWQ
ncbi:uncharacterized protein LOC117049229 [Lacerta agilis]|uniref:uncharacterized protein LOC117049229 n=1 Tax=Lacerta agilis TaxID=80427 RepID=UPI001419F580|nr:uncharacterized protein LOC117049229 [Lacerta agilis]